MLERFLTTNEEEESESVVSREKSEKTLIFFFLRRKIKILQIDIKVMFFSWENFIVNINISSNYCIRKKHLKLFFF